MSIRVILSDDPASVLSDSRSFLAAEPVLHNMILTLLHTRVAHPEPGRYWVAADDNNIVGLVFHSPLDMAANLAVIARPETITVMVDAMAEAGIALPGVNGEAATAARFAGHWTDRCKAAAIRFPGSSIYEVSTVNDKPAVIGQLPNAVSKDRDLVVDWTRRFEDEIGGHISDPEAFVDRWLTAQQVWIWDAGEPAYPWPLNRETVEGVVRLAGVPTHTSLIGEGRGYCSEACVNDLSRRIRSQGYRCILYTDLGNPTSNSIYRRIGYRAVAECLRYRFE